MPRPSKHVSPATLGGHIRVAREHLHLSLADVANGRYSTSLISQIERNRILPSQACLCFLAERLALSLQDLEHFLPQDGELEDTTTHHKAYEDVRVHVTILLAQKEPASAFLLLKDLHLSHVPPLLRWRLIALRGQCHFEQRKFLLAQQDFVYALNELPPQGKLSGEQLHELASLHLQLADSYRELRQLDAAFEHYEQALAMVNNETSLGYAAQAHWGIALLAFAQAHQTAYVTCQEVRWKEIKLGIALKHAEHAQLLYHSMGDLLRAAAVSCQIAHIELALGHPERIRASLEEILITWLNVCDEPAATLPVEKRKQQEIANMVSAAACSLATIELEAREYPQALLYVEQALRAGRKSYKLRRADAYLMRGRILEALNPLDPCAEEAFRCALSELADTHRISARISAHVRLGRHLLKIGKIEEGEAELEQARQLSDLAAASSGVLAATDDTISI